MTSSPDEQPLTRRELRERLRAQQAHDDALSPKSGDSAPAPDDNGADNSRLNEPHSTSGSPQDAPDQTHTGVDSPAEGHEPPPLTRRQARVRARATSTSQEAQTPKSAHRSSVNDTSGAPKAEDFSSGESETVSTPSDEEKETGPEAFGQNSHNKVPAQAFESLIAPEARPSDALTTSSALVLPGASPQADNTPTTGDVLVTGSVDVHRSREREADALNKERLETDDGADNGPEANHTAGTPVSATKAVSTHSVTRDVITPQTKTSSSKLLMILAITAGVLCVAVIGVVIVGLMTGTF